MAELKVRATLDGSQFHSGLSKLGGLTDGLKARLAGAFTVGALAAGVSKVLRFADGIEEMSQRVGISTRALQEWSFAAKQNGTDAEKLVTFIERLTDAAQDMKNAGGFSAMGISPDGMTPEGLFKSVQGKTQGKGATEIQAMLQNAGMSIKAIGPMMNVLQADLGAASEAANRFGAVINDATVHRLAALNDQLSIVGQVLIGHFAPAILAAGIAALRAFSKIKGGAGWAGAMTANMSYQDMILGPFLSKEEQQKIYDKSMPSAAMIEVANDELKNSITGMEEMIKRLLDYKPPELPTVSQGSIESGNAKFKPQGDSLLSVGNFLGAGRSAIDTIAKDTLKTAKAQLKVQEKMLEKLGNKTSIIVP